MDLRLAGSLFFTLIFALVSGCTLEKRNPLAVLLAPGSQDGGELGLDDVISLLSSSDLGPDQIDSLHYGTSQVQPVMPRLEGDKVNENLRMFHTPVGEVTHLYEESPGFFATYAFSSSSPADLEGCESVFLQMMSYYGFGTPNECISLYQQMNVTPIANPSLFQMGIPHGFGATEIPLFLLAIKWDALGKVSRIAVHNLTTLEVIENEKPVVNFADNSLVTLNESDEAAEVLVTLSKPLSSAKYIHFDAPMVADPLAMEDPQATKTIDYDVHKLYFDTVQTSQLARIQPFNDALCEADLEAARVKVKNPGWGDEYILGSYISKRVDIRDDDIGPCPSHDPSKITVSFANNPGNIVIEGSNIPILLTLSDAPLEEDPIEIYYEITTGTTASEGEDFIIGSGVLVASTLYGNYIPAETLPDDLCEEEGITLRLLPGEQYNLVAEEGDISMGRTVQYYTINNYDDCN